MILEQKEIIKKYLAEHRAPARGLIIDIVNYRDHIGLRLYRDNFNEFPDSIQQDLVEWLEKTLKDLNFENKFVVTIEMEGEIH